MAVNVRLKMPTTSCVEDYFNLYLVSSVKRLSLNLCGVVLVYVSVGSDARRANRDRSNVWNIRDYRAWHARDAFRFRFQLRYREHHGLNARLVARHSGPRATPQTWIAMAPATPHIVIAPPRRRGTRAILKPLAPFCTRYCSNSESFSSRSHLLPAEVYLCP